MILQWARWNRVNRYDEIYFASTGNLLFRFILARMPHAKVYTLDDGTANITLRSTYFHRPERKRRFERLLRIPRQGISDARIERHYTLFDGFENIVSKDKLVYQPIDWGGGDRVEAGLTYFIGQPLEEYMTLDQIARLKDWVERQAIDFYVRHPRDLAPLTDRFPILSINNELAEEAIMWRSLGKPTIIAPYSTVLFTIPAAFARKIYLSVCEGDDELERIKLVERVGAEVVYVA